MNGELISNHSKVHAKKIELLLVGLCIVCSTLISIGVARSLGTPEEHYLENRTDPLVFRAVGDLLSEGRSPYSMENQVEVISRTRLGGKLPSTGTTVSYPEKSLDLLAITTRSQLQGESFIPAIPFSYPPNSLPMFRLRALGDAEINAAVYMGTTVFLSLLMLALLLYRYIDDPLTRQVMMLTSILWNPALLDLLLTQTGHLVALLVFSLLFFHDRKPVVAGLALGLLAFKPHYALPLGLVALTRQNWTLLTTSITTFLITSLVSAFLYGWNMWLEFLENATSLNVTLFHMESWLGVAAILQPARIEVIGALAIPVYVVSMALLAIALFKLGSRLDLLGATSLAILVTVIASPNTHPYDMIMFFVPAIYISRFLGTRMWFTVVTLIVFLRPNIFTDLSIVRFCFLLICLLILVWALIREVQPRDKKNTVILPGSTSG